MNHKIIILSLAIIVAGFTNSKAQQVIPASGGYSRGESGSVSYSVGQVVYSFHAGSAGTVSEGVEQPYEILIPVGIEKMDEMKECTLFPNPVSSYVTLRMDTNDFDGLKYYLYSMTGPLIAEARVISRETVIPVEDLAQGAYFLRVTDDKSRVKTFYIIKK